MNNWYLILCKARPTCVYASESMNWEDFTSFREVRADCCSDIGMSSHPILTTSPIGVMHQCLQLTILLAVWVGHHDAKFLTRHNDLPFDYLLALTGSVSVCWFPRQEQRLTSRNCDGSFQVLRSESSQDALHKVSTVSGSSFEASTGPEAKVSWTSNQPVLYSVRLCHPWHSQRSMIKKMSVRKRRSTMRGRGRKAQKNLTVSGYFRGSLQTLMERVFSASPHFVRYTETNLCS